MNKRDNYRSMYKPYSEIDMEENGNHLNDKQSIKSKYWVGYNKEIY